MDNAKYCTVIVDDSAISRGIFEKALKATGRFEIVASLSNGRKAVDFCRENEVDFVLTDYDMPEMNGVETTKILAREMGIAVCVYSESRNIKADALDAGAVLFELKPDFSSYNSQSLTNFIEQILSSLKDVTPRCCCNSSENKNENERSKGGFEVLCIGASTGGPTAVKEVLSGLGKNFPLPILYVQHIDNESDKKMVDWFNSCCPNFKMSLAKNGEIAQKGHVYMAPADTHLIIDYITDDGKIILKLSDEAPERFLKPAVNKLFRSAAKFFNKNCLAILLTGMGRDGAEGCKEIVDKGGYTIVEDKSTCAVFGMPQAAIELGGATRVYPRPVIASQILKLI